MPTLTRAAMHIRVRRLFLEEIPDIPSDFIDVSQIPDEVDEAYDEACAEQHSIVLSAAEATGRLEDYDNPYLAYFLTLKQYSLVRGQYEYSPIPEDLARAVHLDVGGLRGKRISPADDRLIRTWPDQYGPGKNEMFWAMLSQGYQSPPSSAQTRLLRVYVYGDTTASGVPAVPLVSVGTADLTYYRLVTAISYNSPPLTDCDVPDPYNDGPCHGACARLQEKAQDSARAQYHRTIAMYMARTIIPAPGGATA